MKYRDSFFRFYFSDKTRLLALCNALTGEDATDPDEIEIATLDETFFSRRKNDISCIFRDRLLILIEHQTTLNENMPLRFLLYLVKLLNKIYDKEFSRRLYERRAIKLPRPEFFVLYNGAEPTEPFTEMKLSDAFKEPTNSLELKVKFYNINYPYNRSLLAQCLPLEDYCVFVERVKSNKRNGMDDKAAFYEAYKYCAETRAQMQKFLSEHEWELFDMIITEYNKQWDEEAIFNSGFSKGRLEGRLEGRTENLLEVVTKLLQIKSPIEYIVAATGWDEKKILQFAKNIREQQT